jgi:hypothetical protein
MVESMLIDTDILIDHLRKNVGALDFLSSALGGNPSVFLSVISRAEILAGIRKGEEEVVDSLFQVIPSITVDEAIADRAGAYLRKFGKSHNLNIGDALIASTAREMGLSLVTKNVKHFPMRDIEIIRPY